MRVSLLTNGPGELWGWARPVATELRRLGHSVSLWLLPCPFASGNEREAASLLGVDKLEGPGGGVWNAMTMKTRLRRSERTDCVVQLGGDLMFGHCIARASGAPLFCYSYGAKRGMNGVSMLTAFPQQAMKIKGALPIGDLVKDSLLMDGPAWDWPAETDSPRVIFLPGSREPIRRAALPWLASVLAALKRDIPHVRVRTLFPPFMPESDMSPWRSAGLNPVRSGAGAAMREADFALTQPGTNNFELMHCGLPSLVVVPSDFVDLIPISGILGPASKLPLAGRALKRYAAARVLKKWGGVAALPNRLTHRRVMDEMIGDITPEDIASRIAASLRDKEGLAASRRALLEMSGEAGAASRLCDLLPKAGVMS